MSIDIEKLKLPFIIAFEGIEASGKSTQINLLSTILKNYNLPYKALREPGGTKFGENVRKTLLSNDDMFLNSTILMLTAARHENIMTNIIDQLEIILIDRFLLSTLVYQGEDNQDIIRKIKTLHSLMNFNLLPNITFVILADVISANKRLNNRVDNNHFDKQPISTHQILAKRYKNATNIYDGKLEFIDGNQSIIDVHKSIISKINLECGLNMSPLNYL